MEITLNHWQAPNGYARIYVNGLTSTGKVYLENGRKGIKITAGDLSADDVEAAIKAAYHLDELTWTAIETLAKQPKARLKTKPSAAQPIIAGPWTADDAEALDANGMTNPIPEPVTLLVDHREPGEMKLKLASIKNLLVEEAALEVGDYVVADKLIIERKTVTDFITSLTEDGKRLFKQADAMSHSGLTSVLILEGDIYAQRRTTLPSITGTLSYLAVIQRIAIVPTLSLHHSAYMIAKLVRHRIWGLGYDLGLRGAAPMDNPPDAAQFFIEGLPGVSALTAKRLLSHFGSARAVASASEEDLQAVWGIGPTRARGIFRTLNAAFGKD
ncbi:MAG: hypothetical protein DI537_17475 [Stutzerimonas stutzeri]|nr:MAG: hypothetical protein DI537_17475 [Stutzerimonas stutzeri]